MGKKKLERKEEIKKERRRKRRDRLDSRGRELGDSTPMAPALGKRQEPTITERIRQMVRGEALAEAARREGMETFEEADDFDVDDETLDPTTPYEEIFEPPPRDPPSRSRGEGGRGREPPTRSPSRTQSDAADNTENGGGEKVVKEKE